MRMNKKDLDCIEFEVIKRAVNFAKKDPAPEEIENFLYANGVWAVAEEALREYEKYDLKKVIEKNPFGGNLISILKLVS